MFVPAELLYRPYEKHASLQQNCVLSLISAITAKIKDAIQPWYKVESLSMNDILLAQVLIAISVPACTTGQFSALKHPSLQGRCQGL